MAATQKINIGDMDGAVADVNTTAGEVLDIGNDIRTLMEALNGDWQGSAAETFFDSAYAKWQAGYTLVHDNLVWLGDTLQGSSVTAEDSEADRTNLNASYDAPTPTAY